MGTGNLLRRLIFALITLILLATCRLSSVISDLLPGGNVDPFNPKEDLVIVQGEYEYSEMTVSENVTVNFEGDVAINVRGPIQIDGSLISDCDDPLP